MGILDEDVARVREATDIVGLIGETVALKRSGARFTGLCPFHGEKTASFSVNPQLGFYYCFGCHESGDAITFVRKVDGLDFAEAVERLAARAGITLRYDSAGATQDKRRRERLTAAVQEAVDYYHRLLLEDPAGGRARGYLRSRGFDGDAARRFQLGWSPDGYDTLARHLYAKKFSRDDLVEAGLAFVNRAQKAQDCFRSRLMFPTFDRAGNPVGFGGRTLDDNGPKYKNTSECALYHKSRLLYGLNWAKAEIGARDEVVICEGYTDVMGFTLAGVPNAVATCGTALADEHVQILKSFTRHVVLAYDSDSAGQNAAEKWYQWEQRFDIEVKVAALPLGKDPGDLWREDPAALAKSVESASRFSQFKLDRVRDAADLSTPEGRTRALDQAAAVLREIPDERVREQYIPQVVEWTRFDHAAVKATVARRVAPRSGSGGDRRDDGDAPAPRPPVRVDRREEDALRWAVHQGELVIDWMEPALFSDPVAREAFEHLWSADEVHDAIEGAEGPARALLERLAVEEPTDDEPETVRARLVVNIVGPAAERLRRELLANGDERAMEIATLLDTMHNGAHAGWASGEAAAMQLVRCISSWTTS
ncbi:MAG: DNA primase [Acidimicrobiia bacterium]